MPIDLRDMCKCVLLYLALCVFVLAMNSSFSYAATVDRVLATVGDELVTYAEYQKFLKGMDKAEKKDEIDEKVLRILIEDKLMLAEARKMNIDVSDAEVDEAVSDLKKQHGLSADGLKEMFVSEGLNESAFRSIMKDKVRVSKLVGIEIDSKIFVTEQEKDDYYKGHMLDYLRSPANVELRAVFLKLGDNPSVTEVTDLKRKALRIVSLLRKGDSFEQIAEEYSDEPLKSQGGIMGIFRKGMLVPPLNDAAFRLKEGETSEPVWVKEGAYILRVVKKNDDSFDTFEAVREEIGKKIFMQKREKMMNDWIKMLWEKSRVKVNVS